MEINLHRIYAPEKTSVFRGQFWRENLESRSTANIRSGFECSTDLSSRWVGGHRWGSCTKPPLLRPICPTADCPLPLKREGLSRAAHRRTVSPRPATPRSPAASAAPAGPAPRAWHRPVPAAHHAAAPPPAPAPAPGPIRACCAPPRRGRSARSRAPGCPGLAVDAGAGPDRLHLRWKIPVSPVVHPAVSRLETVRGCDVPGQGGSPPSPPEPR